MFWHLNASQETMDGAFARLVQKVTAMRLPRDCHAAAIDPLADLLKSGAARSKFLSVGNWSTEKEH